MFKAIPCLAASALALVLGACVQQAPAPQAQAAARPPGYASERYTPAGFALPGGEGCQGDVARFRAVMSNDYQTGNVNLSVYRRITSEIDDADHVCAAGDAARASGMIRTTRSKFGYPAS
jgi:hypothetical protein